MNSPNLFLIGPPKCATTSLHSYLNNHEQIFMSKIKETHFFDFHFERGLRSYMDKHFLKVPENISFIGESTATYAFLPFVAKRISNNFPTSKIILVVRDPVERAFSEWLMRKGKGDEPLSFLEALEDNAVNFQCLSQFEWLDRENSLQQRSSQPYRVYLQSGYYGQILELYLKYFKPEQICIVSFNSLKSSPIHVLNEIFGFLGVSHLNSSIDMPVLNPYSIKKKYSSLLYTKFGKNKVQFIWKLIPLRVRKFVSIKVNNIKVSKPTLTELEKVSAYKYFEKDMKKFRNLQNDFFSKEIIK